METTIQVLIANGADATLTNNKGKTAFTMANNKLTRSVLVRAMEDHRSEQLDSFIVR